MIIRAEQVLALREPLRRRFEDQLVGHLRAAFAAQVAGLEESDLRSLVRLGIEKAEGHGVTAARHVAGFVALMVCHGADFDAPEGMPGAAAVLKDPSLDAAAKMARLRGLAPTLKQGGRHGDTEQT